MHFRLDVYLIMRDNDAREEEPGFRFKGRRGDARIEVVERCTQKFCCQDERGLRHTTVHFFLPDSSRSVVVLVNRSDNGSGDCLYHENKKTF